jgi:hypothetical protein
MVTYYEAHVRLKVRFADGTSIVREDTGSGNGDGNSTGEACEKASKEAVTDALKRCARKFGNRFGLSLYDKHNPLHNGGEDTHGEVEPEPERLVPAHVKPLSDIREHFAKLGEKGVIAFADTIGKFVTITRPAPWETLGFKETSKGVFAPASWCGEFVSAVPADRCAEAMTRLREAYAGAAKAKAA